MKRLIRWSKFLSLSLILPFVVLLAACAEKASRWYSGPALPEGQVAYLKETKGNPHWHLGPQTLIFIVDGHRTGGSKHELLPGRHWIAVGYLYRLGNSVRRSKTPLVLNFAVVAGHTYWAEAVTLEGSKWYPRVIDITNPERFVLADQDPPEDKCVDITFEQCMKKLSDSDY
jgi:hypothetical protein